MISGHDHRFDLGSDVLDHHVIRLEDLADIGFEESRFLAELDLGLRDHAVAAFKHANDEHRYDGGKAEGQEETRITATSMYWHSRSCRRERPCRLETTARYAAKAPGPLLSSRSHCICAEFSMNAPRAAHDYFSQNY